MLLIIKAFDGKQLSCFEEQYFGPISVYPGSDKLTHREHNIWILGQTLSLSLDINVQIKM